MRAYKKKKARIAFERELIKTLQISNITIHCQKRMLERKVSVDDILHGIESGEIIEQYPEDIPYPSCFVLGTTVNDKVIHIVLSTDGDYIYLITVYELSLEKWEKGFKGRRTSGHDMY